MNKIHSNFQAKKEMSPRLRGSLTLEAAIIYPLFVGFVVAILFFFRVVEIQLSVEKAMDYATRQGASITTEEGQDRGVVFAEAAAFQKVLKDKENSDYPMWPGIIILPNSDKENIALTASYLLKLPLPLIGTKYLLINQKVSSRKWIGYTGGGNSNADASDTVVYVTSNSEVYHTTPECTHLKLTISSVSGIGLKEARSESGSRYSSCHICKPPQGLSTYYIAKEGDRYHMSSSCSGLKRTYYTKLLSEVQGVLRPCSRCGN